MKLFIDSADVKEIYQCLETGFVSGVTTNPTLIKRSGRKPDDVYRELITLGVEDLSMEVVGNQDEMMAESSRLIDQFGNSVSTIKVPSTPDCLQVCG